MPTVRTGHAVRWPAAAGLALLLLTAAGCSADGDAADSARPSATSRPTGPSVDGCDVLQDDTGIQGVEPEGQALSGRTVVEGALAEADRSTTVSTIYLDPPEDDAALARFAAEVEQQPGVRRIRTVDRAATYAAFRRLFAGQTEMLDNVRPEDLPLSVVALVANDDAAELERWARRQPTTYEVRALGSDAQLFGDLPRWLQRAADRRALIDLADQLRRVEGEPPWATVSAEILTHALEAGPEGIDVASGAVDGAVDSLERQLGAC